jgi:thioesterase domain-containing protein
LVSYHALASLLGEDQRFYGLQPHGLDGNQQPQNRIPEMAATYIKEIQQIQPQGPYYLGGICLGGVIAYEMAQQLIAQGQEVGLLVLIDSTFPRKSEYLRLRPNTIMLMDWHLGELLRMSSSEKIKYISQKTVTLFSRIRKTLLKSVGKRGENSVVTQNIRRVMDANLEALANYSPSPYPGKVTLFWCAETPLRAYEDHRTAWSTVAEEGLEVHLIPGDHMSMVEPPHVAVMAKTLQRCLARATAIKHTPKYAEETV